MGAHYDLIRAPERAEIGQGIAAAAVDPDGRPVLWRAVSFPSGGGLTGEQIAALDGMIRAMAFSADPADKYLAFQRAFGIAAQP